MQSVLHHHGGGRLTNCKHFFILPTFVFFGVGLTNKNIYAQYPPKTKTRTWINFKIFGAKDRRCIHTRQAQRRSKDPNWEPTWIGLNLFLGKFIEYECLQADKFVYSAWIGDVDNIQDMLKQSRCLDISSSLVPAGSFVIGQSYAITFIGSTNFVLVGALENAVGVVFTATGIGSGSGAVRGVCYPILEKRSLSCTSRRSQQFWKQKAVADAYNSCHACGNDTAGLRSDIFCPVCRAYICQMCLHPDNPDESTRPKIKASTAPWLS